MIILFKSNVDDYVKKCLFLFSDHKKLVYLSGPASNTQDLQVTVKAHIIPAGGSVALCFTELQPATGLLLSPVFYYI